MSFDDDLSMDDWQRARRGQLLAGGDNPGPFPAPSDDMPMGQWQEARARQVAGATPPNTQARPTPSFDVDRGFLAQVEGSHADMRVPNQNGHVFDESGPTIGVGVDLGSKDAVYLKSLNLDPTVISRLSPYLKMSGPKALAYVKAHPLVLSQPELDALNSAVQDRELGALAKKFDAASQVGPFGKLPRSTQTAIASLYYQYGSGEPEKKTPNFWRQITSGDWAGAHRNLLDFGDDEAYRPRRLKEAELLMGDIQGGTLPRPRQ